MEWWEEWEERLPPLVPEPEQPCSRGQLQWLEHAAEVVRVYKLSIIRAHIVTAMIHALESDQLVSLR